MKNTKKEYSTMITINIERNIWEELQMLKIKGGYRTINDVIKVLLGEK